MPIIVTKDYRITLPKEVREQLHIVPGQKVDVRAEGKMIRMTFLPVEPPQAARSVRPPKR